MKKLLRPGAPLYPFLLSIYPVLYLWNANRGQQPLYVLLPIFTVILLAVAVLYLLAYLAARNAHRAALLATIFSFFVLTYGHLDNLASQWQDGRWQPQLLALAFALVIAVLVLTFLKGVASPNLSKTLNLVALALIVFQAVSLAPYFAGRGLTSAQAGALPDTIPITGRLPSPQRDVYFILIDNYGRQDVLKGAARFDNSQMVDELKKRGFIFPDCAQANYFWTAPAMSSILNMEYLDTLGVEEDTYNQRGHYDEMAPLIEQNLVIRKFRAYGYHTVTFRGFQGLIDIRDADTYISFEDDPQHDRQVATARFTDLFLQTTLFTPLANHYNVAIIPDSATSLDAIDTSGEAASDLHESEAAGSAETIAGGISSSDLLPPEFDEVFRQNHYAYEALMGIPTQISGPKFVYAHIYSAHWPFMLRPDGSVRLPFSKQMTRNGYVDAIQFTNQRLLQAIDAILANSSVPPVIILQGDHANTWVDPVEWSGHGRVKILSAYYLPGGGEALLYDNITPVNNFRLVFKHYFGEDLKLLPDVSRYLDSDTSQVGIAEPTCIPGK